MSLRGCPGAGMKTKSLARERETDISGGNPDLEESFQQWGKEENLQEVKLARQSFTCGPNNGVKEKKNLQPHKHFS